MRAAINGLALWQALFTARLSQAQLVVDATAGNGHDTLFLARHTPATAKVWALDVQEAALAQTAARLERHGLLHKSVLCCRGHEELVSVLPAPPAFIAFNLGYLPGGDHALSTTWSTTRRALEQSLSLLLPGGWLSVMMYPGHAPGQEERDELLAWSEALAPQACSASHWRPLNHAPGAPELLLLEKTGES